MARLEDGLAAVLRAAAGERVGALADILANTPPDGRDRAKPWLLAPLDLQAIKAAGVTFVISMLERVIEERARGNPDAATAIRREVNRLVGDDLAKLKPGSPEAARLKEVMIEQGVWSQYLEVGIGPDAEIFSKAPPMAAVGTGMDAERPSKSRRLTSLPSVAPTMRPAEETASTCAISRAARRCSSRRRRTTTPPAPSARSSVSSTPPSRSTTCAK